METAYQKWEKRRQERTGGHRPALSHRRKKGSVALGPREKRRMAQLAVCLALFLVVFIGKGVFPGKLAEVRETVLSAIQADTDFKAAFASLGRSISEGEPILDTLGDLWVEVFGGEAVTVPDGEGQVSTPLFRAQAAFLSGFPAREDAVSHWLGEAGKPEPVAVEPAETNTVPEPTPVPTATPEPTPEPTPTPAPLLRDTITAEMLGYVYRPADEFWYDEAKTAAVIPYMLAVHYGPGMDWGENMALNMGDTVEILAKQNGWVLLRTADGRYGWAAGELLRETADAPAATATPAAPVNPADPAVPVAPATAAPMAAPTPDYTEVSNPDLK